MTDLFGDHPEPTPLSATEVQFLDTTLRDGEQAPGVPLSPDQKVEIEMTRDGRSVSVATSDADITRASVEAMVEAFDRLLTA